MQTKIRFVPMPRTVPIIQQVLRKHLLKRKCRDEDTKAAATPKTGGEITPSVSRRHKHLPARTPLELGFQNIIQWNMLTFSKIPKGHRQCHKYHLHSSASCSLFYPSSELTCTPPSSVHFYITASQCQFLSPPGTSSLTFWMLRTSIDY